MVVDEGETEDFKKWEHQRSMAFINYCFAAYVYGTSLTVYLQTEYFYVKETVKVRNAHLVYGILWTTYCSSGVVSSLVISYYADKTRNLRHICIVSSIVIICGSILYTLYYSIYVVLLGQLLLGSIAARVVASIGEVSRIFNKDILTHKITILTIFASVGSLSGPCLTFLFKYVNVSLGGWKLTINNMPSIYMLFLSLILLSLDLLSLTNVSNNYASLPEKQKLGDLEAIKGVTDVAAFRKQYILALKCMLKNRPVVVLLINVFTANYIRAIVLMLQPVKFNDYLNWSPDNLALASIITIAACCLPTAAILPIITKHFKKDFYLFLYGIMLLLIGMLAIMLLCYIHTTTLTMKVFAYGNVAFVHMGGLVYHTIARALLLQFVPVEIRTTTDAIRNMLFEFSFLTAGASFEVAATYTKIYLWIWASINVTFFIWLIIDRKSYLQISVVQIPNCEDDDETNLLQDAFTGHE